MLRAITGFAFLSTLLAAPAAFALTITLTPFQNQVSANAGADFNTSSPAAVPESGSVTETDGGNAATTGYSLSASSFEITFNHSRAGDAFGYAQSGAGFNFSLDENVDYALDGLYTAADPLGQRILLQVVLTDLTASSTLFQSYQESNATENESFTLGLEEGDFINALVGSPTGTLIAGHEYQLFVLSLIQTNDEGAAISASASGSATLTFVPEPSATALVALGLVGLVVRRRGVSTEFARP